MLLCALYELHYALCFGYPSIFFPNIQIMLDIICCRNNVFSSDCCRGRLCLARPISPDTKSSPSFSRSVPVAFPCSLQSCNATRFLSISNKTPCLLCQVTLKSYAFYSLQLLICNMSREASWRAKTQVSSHRGVSNN